MRTQTRVTLINRFLKRFNLRFPTLVLLLGTLTLVDFVLPDFIPFIDEIVLALLTALFAMWRNRRPANYQEETGESGFRDFNP